MKHSVPEKLILIGASTGGPGLIESIASSLPHKIDAAVVIAQHMDKISLSSFAARLGRISALPSVLAEGRTELEKGTIYTLSDTAELHESGGEIYLENSECEGGFYHPTIDTLFLSAAALGKLRIYAFLLSGIGSDGARGLLKLKERGHNTVVQDESTSPVYGMPKAALEMGAAQKIAPIGEIVEYIRREA